MDEQVTDTTELRKAINDLLALTALPALWVTRTSDDVVEHVADTLNAMLNVDLIYVHIPSGSKGQWDEALRTNPALFGEHDPDSLCNSLRPYVDAACETESTLLTLPPLNERLRAYIRPLGNDTPRGCLITASERADFPNETERVLCQVASNAATVALQEGDLIRRIKAADAAKAEAIQTLKTITDNTAASLFLIDDEGRCTFMNPTAEAMFGFSFDEVRGKILHELIHPIHPDGTAYPIAECPLNAALARKEAVSMREDVMSRKDGSFVPVLCAANPIIQDDIRIATVIEVHDITERKRVERLQLVNSERESLLSQIGLKIRSSMDPVEIKHTAVTLLGQAIGANRCFFMNFDFELDYMRYGAAWPGPPPYSIEELAKPSTFGFDYRTLYNSGKTLVTDDTASIQWPVRLRHIRKDMEIGASINIPFYHDGNLVYVLCVAMDRPYAWSDDEISLAESVAVQTQSAIEAASVIQREHRIATTLQEALMPSPPDEIPGLVLDAHYQPAMNDSNVGGDFYAVYPIDSTRYAMLIGDVSGKGLKAASQVSCLQHMLRYALSSNSDVAGAITQLNRIFETQNILIGFATIWVGIYDSSNRTITYTSCGHDPALIRRADGTVETLLFSGPPVGAVKGFSYPAHTVTIHDDDVLLLYTDGLSEAGPDRLTYLGQDGLALLLRDADQTNVKQTVQSVIDAAFHYGQGVFRDDVCVVAARGTKTSSLPLNDQV